MKILIFEQLQKKSNQLANNLSLLAKKVVFKLSEIWVRDPGPGPDPGSGKPDPGSGIQGSIKALDPRSRSAALTFVFSAFCLDFKWTTICWVFSANRWLLTPPYSFSISPGIPYSQLCNKQKFSNH
jgi:hypothetical protein